ncbi:MAG: two-component system response regulator OmpR [Burkholderiaceae bacterium]|nr:two-component system response regulator OmpR [Burkholderiaceae bacterium]
MIDYIQPIPQPATQKPTQDAGDQAATGSQSPATIAADKIVVVDDDARILDLLQRYLTQEGYKVVTAQNANALTRVLAYQNVNLIVLDVMMPGEDGLSVARRLRAGGNKTPIIMLTAKDEDADRIIGLEVGADDYLGKPFNPRELLARVRAVLRRRPAQEMPGAPSSEGGESIRFGPFIFNLTSRTLTRDGQEVPLSTGEFAMLKALARNARQPLAREKLAQLSRGRAFAPYERSLDVQISRLRKLIEPNPANPRYLQTVWGVGYVFVPDGATYA